LLPDAMQREHRLLGLGPHSKFLAAYLSSHPDCSCNGRIVMG
jgi:hypothetical protein